MLGGSKLIGATMRAKVESVGKPGSVSIAKTNTISPGTKVRNAVEPARNTEDVQGFLQSKRQADETATLGIEPVAESR